jgi:hypothetical protein
MRQKWSLIVGLVLLLEVVLVVSASASTAGIPGISTTGRALTDTIKGIGYFLSIVLIIAAIAIVHHGQSIGGVLVGLLGAGLVVAVILFAEDIVNFVKPDAAAAFTGGWPLDAGLTQAWCDLGTQILWYAGNSWTLMRLRRWLYGR